MARKRRIKKLEKKLAGLAKSVSRLEGEIHKTGRRVVGSPAKRAGSAERIDTREASSAKRTTGHRATTARKSNAKRATAAARSTGMRARTGGRALRGRPV